MARRSGLPDHGRAAGHPDHPRARRRDPPLLALSADPGARARRGRPPPSGGGASAPGADEPAERAGHHHHDHRLPLLPLHAAGGRQQLRDVRRRRPHLLRLLVADGGAGVPGAAPPLGLAAPRGDERRALRSLPAFLHPDLPLAAADPGGARGLHRAGEPGDGPARSAGLLDRRLRAQQRLPQGHRRGEPALQRHPPAAGPARPSPAGTARSARSGRGRRARCSIPRPCGRSPTSKPSWGASRASAASSGPPRNWRPSPSSATPATRSG